MFNSDITGVWGPWSSKLETRAKLQPIPGHMVKTTNGNSGPGGKGKHYFLKFSKTQNIKCVPMGKKGGKRQ